MPQASPRSPRRAAVATTASPGSVTLERNVILQGECVEILCGLPDRCVDLVFADPPYNLQLAGDLHRPDQSRVDAVDDHWDQFESFDAYDRFTSAWLSECRRILKPDGSLWVIGSYHNIFRVGRILQDLGYWIQNDVVWVKASPMPNFRGKRFCNAHETLIWATPSQGSRPTFNYASMKSMNDDRQMRSDWTLPLCTGAERLVDGDGEKVHPTQKPVSLLERVLMATTRPGDLVLDPFFGTGTTGAAAKRLHRDWIGIEREDAYVQAARSRISEIVPISDPALAVPFGGNPPPRVPIGSLLAAGLLRAGEVVSSSTAAGSFTAVLAADGSLICGIQKGSIHGLGAMLTGKPSCNGWTFWSVERDGSHVSLDTIRRHYAESPLFST